MSREDFKIEFVRSFFRLAVLILLTANIVMDDRTMWTTGYSCCKSDMLDSDDTEFF